MNTPLRQLTLDLPHRTAFGREDFLIAPCNRDAVGMIDRWPEWGAPALVVYGPAACGKSHLAAVWAERTKAAFLLPEQIANQDADVLVASAPHLVIERCDLLIGDRELETKLFHIYNLCREEQRSLLLTSCQPLNLLNFVIADLASRLRAAPSVAISPPDEDLLSSLLVKQFADRQLNVSADIIRYALPRMERSFAAARELVDRADARALSEQRAITLPIIRQVLFELSED